jgi:SAM-dependent methyltransferase
MRHQFSAGIRQQVRETYTAIAQDFDRTRLTPWEDFHHFPAYVRQGARVLDLGCGNGRLLEVLKPKAPDYLGIDQSPALVTIAKKRYPDARFEEGDMAGIRLPENAFDNIFCLAAFHHLPDRRSRARAVAQMRHALKPGGVLVVTVWGLFQLRLKYWRYLGRAIASWLLHFGRKYAWNDVWIPWADQPLKRYYHAFTPKELRRCFPSGQWAVVEFYYAKKGNRVSFWKAFNLCLILRKI